jgi:hypothetical protein
MALVSPGIQISVNDQSQFVSSNVGSVPLVLLATAQDKTYNGAAAVGTSKTNAGKLQSFTSQRDLVTALGTPTFQLSSAGTPINGSELNEYGLLAAYSALGLGNQLFAIRADIDLAQLKGTSVRPAGNATDSQLWLDLKNTEFGIYVESATGSFTSLDSNLLLITDSTQVFADSNYAYTVSTPNASVGSIGSYALVFTNPDGTTPNAVRLFYKASAESYGNLANTWVQVGSSNWQNSVKTLQATSGTPNFTAITTATLTINTVTITVTGTGVSGIVTANDIKTAINNAAVTGVKAMVTAGTNLLTLFATNSATSNGSVADGKIVIADGTSTPLAKLGITPGTYYCPYFMYGTFAQEPASTWAARPAGSIWWKTTSTGVGFNPSLKQYSASLNQWIPLTVPMFSFHSDTIYGLDSIGGGVNIAPGQIVALNGVIDTTSNGLHFDVQLPGTEMVASGAATLANGNPLSWTSGTIRLYATQPGLSSFPYTTITLAGGSAQQFVTDILNANIPNVIAQVNADNTSVSIIHTTGGDINVVETSGTPMTGAGFANSSDANVFYNTITGVYSLSNFINTTTNVTFSTTQPYSAPADGTYWYYSNPADVDIMINTGAPLGWRGYKNVSSDSRGYPLTTTNPTGVIVSASKPTAHSDNGALVRGDLWLDSSDLENYPALYRYNGTAFVAIDKTDQTSANGIVFADARWDSAGTTNVISGNFPSITTLLTSDYIDEDAPDYRLYPRGTLLFNTRRSGYNVKKFVKNYFNATSFPSLPAVPNASGTLPTIKDAWVTVSGLNEDGSMKAGSTAQRSVVVAALQSAVDSNIDIREDNYNFNLLVAPGYPELIDNLVMLNNDRGDTGFVIGDTPMTLAPNTTDITAWNNNTNGNGLATASPYLGVYYPAGLTNDLAGNTVAVPASHAALRTFLYNDNVSYQWFAPAGVHRGLVDNLNDIGYINAKTGAFVHNGINQGLRDSLYSLGINPITQLPGTGLVVWGQVTKSGDTSARNRVNVVRLENYLRTSFKSIANGFLFEPNDTITRKSIATQIESACHDLLSKRGLYDFLVICDTSNNTPSTIANNQLYVDVAIEPMKDVEFIYIPIALYNPGTIANLGARST